jgi:hypothetical protein
MSGVAGEVQAVQAWRGRVSALQASRGWGGEAGGMGVALHGLPPMATDWRRFAAPRGVGDGREEEGEGCGAGMRGGRGSGVNEVLGGDRVADLM